MPTIDQEAQAVSRALALAALLQERGPLTTEELRLALGCSHRQVNRYLRSLRAAGWVEREPERRGIRMYHKAAPRPPKGTKK
jgi:predicted transcriptional regulator